MKVGLPAKPTADWRYDDPDYGDAAQLETELRRVAEICHQCRRCLPLCPSFPTLFDLIDATDREVAGVTNEGFDRVNELCFHCKLCYNHCPYTPPHEWDVDFPALMRRHQLARTKRDGVPLARKLTTKTDLLGKIGSAAPALMNFANTNRFSRVMMEKNDVLFIDVRSMEEFDMGHLPGAQHVPYVDIEYKANGLMKETRPIVAYCA